MLNSQSNKLHPSLYVLGVHTFWGCYTTYRSQIVKEYGWNEDTAKAYDSSILNKIVKHIKGHDQRPLRALTKLDFTETLDAIRKEGYMGENGTICTYDSETLNRFQYLMEVVTETGEKNYLCRNVLAKSIHQSRNHEQRDTFGMIVPKYMSPDLELKLGNILLNDPMQDGALMGLAGMYSWGGRNAEAAGLNYGDIRLWHNIPECWVAWVYKTTKLNSNQLQSSGKSRNADRVVLLPNRYVALVMERKKMLQQILGDNTNIDDLPVACKGDDYERRCSADDLTEAAKKVFAQLRVPSEQLMMALDEVQYAKYMDPLHLFSGDLVEKEPTAYYLRRLYGTALACAGLTEQDVAFQIGHDLGTVPEYRNELLNTSKLLEIKQKLDRRPVVNVAMPENVNLLPAQGVVSVNGSIKQIYLLNPKSQRVELHLSAKEPLDHMHIRIQMDGSNKVSINETSYTLENDSCPSTLDVSVDYQHIFDRESN